MLVAPVVAVLGLAGVLALRQLSGSFIAVPAALQTWLAVMLAICVQAVPFLVLGIVVSAAIPTFVPAGLLERLLPRHPGGAVMAAGLAGAVLPGCECVSVPVSQSLMRSGIPPAPALAFMLAAPAINPIVLVATAVAFPGQPMIVIARFLAGLIAAMTVGWVWIRAGRQPASRPATASTASAGNRLEQFRRTAQSDFLHAGGFLVFGAAVAATLHVVVPVTALDAVARHHVLAVLSMGLLAVAAAICSEADAFIAASLTSFSPTAQLVFMTVSPMVDSS